MASSKPETIVQGPLMLGTLEVHVCRCPRLVIRELEHVFPHLAQATPESKDSLLVIPTNQNSSVDLVKVGEAVETEKDRCLEVFMEFGKAVCTELRARGHWADFIDPCSGLPMLTKDTTKVFSEVDSMQTLLHYATMDAGMCKVLLHPTWGSSVYPATAFTDAPLETLQAVLNTYVPPS